MLKTDFYGIWNEVKIFDRDFLKSGSKGRIFDFESILGGVGKMRGLVLFD